MAAKIAGKEPRSRDPAVSEWGNPAEFILGHSVVKLTCLQVIQPQLRVPPELKHLSKERKRNQ